MGVVQVSFNGLISRKKREILIRFAFLNLRHVLTKNKFDLIQQWKVENGGFIEKFDDISQIKGISKKTIENLRQFCATQLKPDDEQQQSKDTVAEQSFHEYNNPDILFETNNFSPSENPFIFYDERTDPSDFHSQPKSASTPYPARSSNQFAENSSKNFKSSKLVLEPKLTKYTGIRSFTSIYQDATAIACTRFSAKDEWEHGIKVETWDFHKIQTVGPKQLYQVCDNLAQTVDRLPISDIYIIDDHIKMQHFRKAVSPKRVAEIIQMSQQWAILVALLQYKSAHRTADPKQPKVFFMGYSSVGRLYDLFVGREAISTQSIIINILNSCCISPRTDSIQSHENPSIEFSDEIKNTYFKSYPVERECLGKSMLIGLTFIQLGLLRANKKTFPNT